MGEQIHAPYYYFFDVENHPAVHYLELDVYDCLHNQGLYTITAMAKILLTKYVFLEVFKFLSILNLVGVISSFSSAKIVRNSESFALTLIICQ